MSRPRLLDLFCCAGGAGMGYHRAGFEVVGIDIAKQPRYPFEFHQADALEYLAAHGHEFDAIHASPPCQEYSVTKSLPWVGDYPKLIDPVRDLLIRIGKPYVIENVPGAPLVSPVTLCGTMFGLKLIRHRLFETSPVIWFPPASCACKNVGTASHRGFSSFANGAQAITVAGNNYAIADGRQAMGIDWMSKSELSEAIPPAYTEYIGKQLLAVLEK
jgi:DNA (cytosine-5)-methyltransferase 1